MAKTLTEMAAEIVAAKAGRLDMNPVELRAALYSTFTALDDLKKMEERNVSPGSAEDTAALDETPAELAFLRTRPKSSIKKNKVVCLECGQEFRMLTGGHLKEHGLTGKEYRKRWGFKGRQPLAALSLSAKRRESAAASGLGEKLKLSRQVYAKEGREENLGT